jgi:hypothetical protein
MEIFTLSLRLLNRFQPNQRIAKVDAIVALTSGLGLNASDWEITYTCKITERSHS